MTHYVCKTNPRQRCSKIAYPNRRVKQKVTSMITVIIRLSRGLAVFIIK